MSAVSRERAAAVVFGVLVAVTGPAVLWLNRDQWFFLDEFAFLFKRDITDPATLLRPHWGHFTALPALLYQALYRVFGLHHYWPYQVPVVAAHLFLACQVRAFARRCEVDPWIATVCAAALLFFGPGRENIAWGFQVTLTGGLALAFGALLTADHDTPSPRRLAAAAALAALAVTCSNVGLIAVISIGLTLGLRRGRTVGLAVTVPALGLYALWSVVAPDSEFDVPPATIREAIPFGLRVMWESIDGFSRFAPAAVVVIALCVVGAVLTVRDGDWTSRSPLTVVGLGAGAVLTSMAIGMSRAADAFISTDTGRYTYVVVALGAVPVAILADRVATTFGGAAWAVVPVVLGVGVPLNALMLSPSVGEPPLRSGDAAVTAWMAELLPESTLAPDDVVEGELVAGQLIDAARAGRLPDAPFDDREARANALLVIAIGSLWDDQDGSFCEPIDLDRPVTVEAGQVLSSASPLWIHVAEDGRSLGRFGRVYSGPPPYESLIRFGPVDLLIEPVDDGAEVQLCTPPR